MFGKSQGTDSKGDAMAELILGFNVGKGGSECMLICCAENVPGIHLCHISSRKGSGEAPPGTPPTLGRGAC